MQDIEQFKLIAEMSNVDYHAQRELDAHFFSSSQLKKILDSEKGFYDTYLGPDRPPKKDIPAFAVGSAFHTSILEPHLLDEECIVYPGKTRSGKAWIAFKEEHSDKAILTQGDWAKAQTLIKAVEQCPISQVVYSGGVPELSLFVTYCVTDTDVYLVTKDSIYRLDVMAGWLLIDTSSDGESFLDSELCSIIGGFTRIQIKVRSDYNQPDMGYIADLKSTTGDPRDESAIQDKIKQYEYEFSAILYLDAFNAERLYNTGTSPFKDFVWTFATKDYVSCKNWMMSSDQTLVGRAKEIKSLLLLARNMKEGWEFPEAIDTVGINQWEFAKWCPTFKQSGPEVNELGVKLLELSQASDLDDGVSDLDECDDDAITDDEIDCL